MSCRIERAKSQRRASRRAFEVFAICDNDPERLTALSFLRRERPRTRIYFFIDEEGSTPQLELWK